MPVAFIKKYTLNDEGIDDWESRICGHKSDRGIAEGV